MSHHHFVGLVSFIIPVFNQIKSSQVMLTSLLETIPQNLKYEIIIIDDASTDATQVWLKSLVINHVKVIFNEVNLGYAKSNNKAINSAKGDILVLLNNDLILRSHWLEPMLNIMINPALDTGIVGNIQWRVADMSVDHSGVYVTPLAKIEHRHELDLDSVPFYRVFAVTGACCLLLRKDFIAVGGFDENFVNGGEDIDLCLKIKQLNKYIYVANTSHIKHHVSLTRARVSLSNEKNSQYLFSKWKDSLLQEIIQSWLDIFSGKVENKVAFDLHLTNFCYHSPHLTSLLLANCLFLHEESRWNKLFDNGNQLPINSIEKSRGFYWDKYNAAAYIKEKAFLIVSGGSGVYKFSIQGRCIGITSLKAKQLNCIKVLINVNHIQEKSFKINEKLFFNWELEIPIFREKYFSIVSIEFQFESDKDRSNFMLHRLFEMVRFDCILFDDQPVLSFENL